MTLLEVQGLSKAFGGVRANDRLSFRVRAGEVLGLIGPNGAGKSTLFDLLMGYQQADAGMIRFAGRSVRGLRPDQLNRLGMARTFQQLKLFQRMSVAENVMVGALQHTASLPLARDRALAILERVGLLEKQQSFAHSLSTGQRKRLELARALATRPRLLLLDEITAGVDMPGVAGLIALVRQLKAQGMSLIMVEHDMQVLMALADRVLALHLGRKIAEGTPQEIQQNQAVIKSYLGAAYA